MQFHKINLILIYFFIKIESFYAQQLMKVYLYFEQKTILRKIPMLRNKIFKNIKCNLEFNYIYNLYGN